MSEKKYAVLNDRGQVLATDMSLEMTLIFIKGIINEYYNETFEFTIKEIPLAEKNSEVEEWLTNL